MGYIEIFELKLSYESKEAVILACQTLRKALEEKVPGVRKARFLMGADDPFVLLQEIHWDSKEVAEKGQKAYFSLPEITVLSFYLQMPPRRVGNFEAL